MIVLTPCKIENTCNQQSNKDNPNYDLYLKRIPLRLTVAWRRREQSPPHTGSDIDLVDPVWSGQTFQWSVVGMSCSPARWVVQVVPGSGSIPFPDPPRGPPLCPLQSPLCPCSFHLECKPCFCSGNNIYISKKALNLFLCNLLYFNQLEILRFSSSIGLWYYLIYLTLHWPLLINNPIIFVKGITQCWTFVELCHKI